MVERRSRVLLRGDQRFQVCFLGRGPAEGDLDALQVGFRRYAADVVFGLGNGRASVRDCGTAGVVNRRRYAHCGLLRRGRNRKKCNDGAATSEKVPLAYTDPHLSALTSVKMSDEVTAAAASSISLNPFRRLP